MKERMIKRFFCCGSLFISLLFCLSGCVKGTMLEEKETWNIGVVLKTMDSEHWQGIRSGMENTARQYNVNLTLFYPADEGAEEEQKVMIKDLLEADIDALIVSPCNSTNTSWFVDLAEEKGIELFAADTRSLDRDIPYIGIDNLEVGRLAAQFLDQNLPDDSKMAVIAGASTQAQTIDRVGAFQKELIGLPGLDADEIMTVKENSGFADALYAAKELIGKDVKGVFCASAVMGLGAAASAEEQDTDLCIVTIDTQDDAMKAVQRGDIDGLITHSGYEVGQTAIETVAGCLEGRAKENVYISCEMLTQDNVDEYLNKRED